MLKQKITIQIRSFLLFLFIIVMSSCATSSNSIPISSDSKIFDKGEVSSQLQELNTWKISGVIGIRYNGEAESANYIWQQQQDKFFIKIYGPLGIGSVEVVGNSNDVELTDNKGNKIKSNNVESLLQNQLGWYVPVNGLKYWIKGIQDKSSAEEKIYNGNNLLQVLDQDGWLITYKNYNLVDNKYPLPSKVYMSRDNVSLKIVIKSWQIL